MEAERGMCMGAVDAAGAEAAEGAEEAAGVAGPWAEAERAVGGSEEPRSIFTTGESSGRHCQGGGRVVTLTGPCY